MSTPSRPLSEKKLRPLTDEERALAEEHLHLCVFAARSCWKRYPAIPQGEYLSAAFDGLADAAKGFDPRQGVMFETYAKHRVRFAVADMLRRERGGVVHLSRVAAAKGRARDIISIDAPSGDETWGYFRLPPSREPSPGAEMESREVFESLLTGLSARKKAVIRGLYGAERLTMRQIGDTLGISEWRVGQMHAEALRLVAARAVRLGLGRASEVTTDFRFRIFSGRRGDRQPQSQES